MNKVIILFVALPICYLIFSISCTEKNESCGPFDNRFKIISMRLRADRIINRDSIKIIYASDTLKSYDTIKYNKLALKLISVQKTYIADIKLRIGFIDFANACSPIPPYSDEYIYFIKVTCDKDYDNKHLVGEDLVDIFKVAVLDRYKKIYNRVVGLKDFIELRENCKDELNLILDSPPQKIDTFQFTVHYCQTGSEPNNFIMKSLKVVIEP